jgi:uncharacterized protein (DUF1684 family)
MAKANYMNRFWIVLFLCIATMRGYGQKNEYIQSINDWHAKRAAYLKQPDGWLNLEGLFWFNKGVNSFGSDPASSAHYSNSSFPAKLGSFIYEGDSVLWQNSPNKAITINGKLYSGQTPITVFNAAGTAASMDWSHFNWVVIKREDKTGIRFRNYKAPLLKTFKGLDYYPVQSKWRIKAKLEKPVQDFIMISNILGQTTAQKTAGKLHFKIDGVEYTLDAINEGGNSLFVAFADATSGKQTYVSGRFIDVEMPDAAGYTFIDFNKAYNPPCAFTAFATCPLPPAQNRLSIAITAGEKKYGHH